MNLLGGNSFLQNSNRYCDQCSAYQGQSPICLACLSLLHFCSLQSWDGLINGHDVCLPRHLNVHSVDGVRHSGSTFSLPSQDLHVANACKTPRALPPPPSDPQDGPWSRGIVLSGHICRSMQQKRTARSFHTECFGSLTLPEGQESSSLRTTCPWILPAMCMRAASVFWSPH